jgi:hypothetical protein
MAFVALGRWRKQARVPRVVEPLLLRVPSRHGVPGDSRRRGKLLLDQRAIVFRVSEPSSRNWIARYRDVADARWVRMGTEGQKHDLVAIRLRDGMRTAFTAPDIASVLEILGAQGVAIGAPVSAHDFLLDRHGTDPVDPDTLTPAAPLRREQHNRQRIWMVTGAAVLTALVLFVALAVVTDAHDPNRAASQDDVDAVARRARHDMDRWRLPSEIVRSEATDRSRAFGYGGIEVVRHFEPAAGVAAQDAIDAFASALGEQGYRFEREFDGSWQGEGNCRWPDYPECVLAIEIAGSERDRVVVTFLP